MLNNNYYLRSKKWASLQFELRRRSWDRFYKGTNQEQMGIRKFQEIADQRYLVKMAALYGKKQDIEKDMQEFLKRRTYIDIQKNWLFFRKWN